MAIVNGQIVATGQAITVDLPTARAPELQAFTEIADDDILVGWDADENKTKKMTTAQLRAKFNGNAIPETPVLSGADMEIEIPAVLIGQNRIDIPALAGYTFSLTRRGIGRLKTSEFNMLSTGGFQLTTVGDLFVPGDFFIAHIYELEGGSTQVPGGGGTTPPSLIAGIKTITINTTLVTDDLNKLINISGVNVKIVLTLPDVTEIPENTIIPIETVINNNFQSTISTQNGQFIYFRGTGSSKVYMGKGEVLWVMSGADGWYVISAYGNYLDVGTPIYGYSNMLNTIIAEGQLVNKDSYPRLWEYAQTIGSSLIADDQWQSDPATYRGFFSTGEANGLTFRVPDLRGVFIRGLDRGRGIDTTAPITDKPGSYAKDYLKDHVHETNIRLPGSSSLTIGTSNTSDGGSFIGTNGITGPDGDALETAPKRVGLLNLIKV